MHLKAKAKINFSSFAANHSPSSLSLHLSAKSKSKKNKKYTKCCEFENDINSSFPNNRRRRRRNFFNSVSLNLQSSNRSFTKFSLSNFTHSVACRNLIGRQQSEKSMPLVKEQIALHLLQLIKLLLPILPLPLIFLIILLILHVRRLGLASNPRSISLLAERIRR